MVGAGHTVPPSRARMGLELHAKHKRTADPTHGHKYRMPWSLVLQLRAEYRPHVRGCGATALATKYGVGRYPVERVVTYRGRLKPPKNLTWWDLQKPVVYSESGASTGK